MNSQRKCFLKEFMIVDMVETKKNNLSFNKLFSVVGTIGWNRTNALPCGHALLVEKLVYHQPNRQEKSLESPCKSRPTLTSIELLLYNF